MADMLDASLAEKYEASLALCLELARAHDPARAAVAFTGGKDSTVALALWREALCRVHGPGARPVAVSLDTGLKFPEVLAVRDALAGRFGAALHVLRPAPDCAALPEHDKRACCAARKIGPLLHGVRELGLTLLITGIRRDEHPARAGLAAVEPQAEPAHLRAHPLLEWTEMDVWAWLMQERLPYCELYDQGYRSLGCAPCTEPAEGLGAERAGRAPDKEAHMEQLRALGYF